MLARIMAFVVWGLLACSGVYWLVQLLDKPLPSQALPVSEQSLAAADLTRLFGAAPVAAPQAVEPAMDSRLKLLGLVAPKSAAPHHADEGVALIAVDGVARTVRVGALVDGELRLLAVNARSVGLGRDGVVSLNLQLAAPMPAATGALAPAMPSTTVLGGNPQARMPGVMPGVMPPLPQGIVTPVMPDQPVPENQGRPTS